MAENKHFSHQHSLTFHNSLEAAHLLCSGCKFPCTGSPVYSCRPCKFFLHERCFRAKRALTHPLHPAHPLTLLPSPTYTGGAFCCNLCIQPGSGFSFSCTTCEFDLHVHCAYEHKPKTASLPDQIKIKSHPNHALRYVPYSNRVNPLCQLCDVCGTLCDANGPIYRCDVCDYDAHIECVNLPETVNRGDHGHALTLLHVNPYSAFECDVCGKNIEKNHCMYICRSGCKIDYGMHVKCVSEQVVNVNVNGNGKEGEMSDREFQMKMFRLQEQLQRNKMKHDHLLQMSQMNHDNLLSLTSSGYNTIRFW